MKLKLRLFVERHRDDRLTASVLGLPREAGGIEAFLGVAAAGSQPVSALAAHGDDRAQLDAVLAREVARRVEDLSPAQLAAWRFDPDAKLDRIEVKIAPVDWDGSALEPIALELAVVTTEMPEPPHRVLVPRLGLSLAVSDSKKALEAARTEAVAVLKRQAALRGLDRLHALHPASSESLETLEVEVVPKTPLAAAEERSRDAEAARGRAHREDAKVLESVATDLVLEAREGKLPRAFENDALVDEVLAFLRSEERALLLVGPSGSGKSAALFEAIHRLASGSPPVKVWHATGSRLVAGMSGFGDWQERCRAVVSALRSQKAVLSIGDPHELAESGQAIGFDVSIAQYLKRPIEEGRLRVIGECTAESREVLERRDRGFASLFRTVKVAEPDRACSLRIVERCAAPRPGSRRSPISREALARCHDLHARFAPYEAFPGKAIRFLDRIDREIGRDPERTFGRADLTRAFARATGLPEVVLADDVPLDPDSVRAFFRERVVGQEHATGLVSDLVARVKAGVADPRRPLGSFLFLGPTGVGKTETAKALAEFLFSSRERIVRLDMTEYQDPLAAARLVGGALGEAGDLTRAVRAEPLSVVLLDEIEKAHPSVYDLLLQVLGDARLTDARGRLADFRSAIVILTSNLGAELPEGSLGFDERGDERGARFLKAAEAFFRPELVNRIDAIVPFSALPRDAIRKIASREIGRALERDGLVRRGTAARLSPALLERVLEAGFHPRFGARPLKRAIERLVVRPLSFYFAERAEAPREVEVELASSGEPEVRLVAPTPAARTESAGETRREIRTPDELLERLSGLRRLVRAQATSDLAREVDDEAETLRSFFRRGRPQAFAAESQKHRRLARLEAALRATNDARRTAEDLEDLGIAILLERDHDSAPAVAADVGSLARAIDAAVFRLRATRFEPADAVLLLVAPLPREKSIVRELASSYLRFAVSHRFEIAAWAETRKTKHPGKPLVPAFASVETPPILAGLEEDAEPVARWTGAFVFVVSGENAVACFAGEDGRHRHVPAKDNLPDRHALVRAVPIPPPRELGEQGLARALAKLHTVKIEGEDAPRGVPAALPEVARVYRDRGRVPEITDPRTGRAVNDARLADAWRFQDELASAFLERLEGEPSREAALA